MHIVSLGALLAGSLLVPLGAAPSGWQSLSIEQKVNPIFPRHLLNLGVTHGEAWIVIDTDADGKLVDWLATGYTNKEFADAAVTAIKQWNYTPARLNGEPVGTIVELDFQYSSQGIVVSTTTVTDFVEARNLQMLADSFASFPCAPRELDRVPAAIVKIVPFYGTDLAKKGIKGSVRVNFYIDETGAVRMPSVAAEDGGLLTTLAIEALKQWKFSPPTCRGRAVLVKASEEFRFGGGS